MRPAALLFCFLVPVVAGCASSGSSPKEADDDTKVGPLYSSTTEGDEKETTFLFPIYRHAEDADTDETWVLPLYRSQTHTDTQGHVDSDWFVLPLVYGGHDDEEGDYFLVFPFYGDLKGRFGKEEINMVAFPIYVDSRDADGYQTTNVIWPLVSWGEGEKGEHFRALPFYYREDIEGKSWERAVIWPLVSWGESYLNTPWPEEYLFVLPFYGYSESEVAWSRAYLWPFFTFAGSFKGYEHMDILWPVYRREREADGDYQNRLWPLAGAKRVAGNEESFFLWPLFWSHHWVEPQGYADSFSFIPFIKDTTHYHPDGSERKADFQLWPISVRRRENGKARFSILGPVPVEWEKFENNWRWAWTLWETRTGPDEESYLLISGLLGYERKGEEACIRLLWGIRIPI